ncbi:cytochrome C assembly family protein [Salibacterium qingdaonense]|uniref:HemX family protein n=1 Tax=Salibacterium qingdaonense TaxID=266892 RepID=A0A1I4MRK2_9BACI|nr:cytochrome c biogenesis protein CcsA [Salibacterium qingdaonense]SFM05868.1 HemX family protein [Salibacterium qingdaonense]
MVASAGIIYALTIVLYSLSVLGYFIDFLQNNRKVNRIAFWLLSIVWMLQTLFFVIRALQYDRLPIITPFEGLFFYAWLLVSLSLIINWFFRVDFLVFFTNVVGFVMMAFSLFTPGGDVPSDLNELLISELLIVHVTLIMVGYAAFTIAFVFAALYVFQHHLLKQKRWGKRLLRLDNLPKMERFIFWMTTFGVPFMLLGFILGFVWASIQLSQLPWLDAKVIGSAVVLAVYSAYLYLWAVRHRRGYNMALFNIAGFMFVLINYFLSSELTDFHFWYF